MTEETRDFDTIDVPFFGLVEYIPNKPHNYFLRIQKKMKFLDDFKKIVDSVNGTLDPNETYLERFAKAVREDFARPYCPWFNIVHHTAAGKIQLLVTININPHQPLGRFPILIDVCLHCVTHTAYKDDVEMGNDYKTDIENLILERIE